MPKSNRITRGKRSIDEYNADLISGILRAKGGEKLQSICKSLQLPRSTLRGRLQGAQPVQEAKQSSRRLSLEQEEVLIKWILDEERAGRAPPKWQLKSFAELILEEGGDHEPIGNNWVDRFLERHGDIKTKIAHSLEAARAHATTYEAITAWFDIYTKLLREYNVDQWRLYNMDEHGFHEGGTRSHKVVGTSETNCAIVTESDSSTWVSIIEAGSAAGRRLTPCVIFKGTDLQGQWFPEGFPNWGYAASPSGWSNSDIAIMWLRDIFLPQTKPDKPGQWRILVIDNHSTHIPLKFMYLAWKNKVYCLYLEAHSSHITQPFDFGVFSPLKNAFYKETRRYADLNTTAPIHKQRFIECYHIARDVAATEKNIISGFEGTGLWPVNVNKVLSRIINTKQLPGENCTTTPPERSAFLSDSLWNTPEKGSDIQAQRNSIEVSIGSVARDITRLAKKAGKTIDSKNAQLAAKDIEIEYLKAKIASQKATGRARVKVDPNRVFPLAGRLGKAQEEAEQATEHYEKAHAGQLEQDAADIAGTDKKSMYINFQL